MRHHDRHKEKKGLFLVGFDESQGFLLDQIRRIGDFVCPVVSGKIDFLLIFPKVSRIVAVRIALTVVPVKLLKSLIARIT